MRVPTAASGAVTVAILPGGERKILLKKNIIAILPGDKHLLVFSGWLTWVCAKALCIVSILPTSIPG